MEKQVSDTIKMLHHGLLTTGEAEAKINRIIDAELPEQPIIDDTSFFRMEKRRKLKRKVWRSLLNQTRKELER